MIRLQRLLRPRSEVLEMEQPNALASAQSEALLLPAASSPDPPHRRRHSAFLEGFSLHSGVHLHASDREGLEKLCGYGVRPPLSLERLSAPPDGRLVYRLKRRLPGGPRGPCNVADRAVAPAGDTGAAAAQSPRALPSMHWAECLARVDTRFAETTGGRLGTAIRTWVT